MNTLQRILEKSKEVDNFWKNFSEENLESQKINFGNYKMNIKKSWTDFLQSLDLENNSDKYFFIADRKLNLDLGNYSYELLDADERKTKNVDFIEKFITQNGKALSGKILIAVGGGVILDTSLCIAEKLNLKIIFVPTTVLAMSDSCIGGKARANKIILDDAGNVKSFEKHFYKSHYEPSEIVLCKSFLESLPDKTISFGCAEIVKHAFLQSQSLLDFLLSDYFQPFSKKVSLLKAILWKADLHRVCLEIDPHESEGGSKNIIRAGHDFSDRLEKESGFTVSHGEAVMRGLGDYLKKTADQNLLENFQKLKDKLQVKNN